MSAKILTVVGARPQFIKAAAVSRAIADVEGMNEVLVHTGQHFDAGMSEIFFDELSIPAPHYNLEVHGGLHGDMTGRMLAKLETVMVEEKPDVVLVYGDTNSTLAGALAASKLGIKLAHVEAGLRSFNRAMPEEINRVVADHVSNLLFCPTRTAIANLSQEGIVDGVHAVGDVMYDSTLYAIERAKGSSTILSDMELEAESYALTTVHRAENTDDPKRLAKVIDWLKEQASLMPVVMPLHPRTKAAVEKHGLSLDGIKLCDPVGYLDMTQLISNSKCVYCDSGGLQKEAYFHRKPCVTLREETEWVETIECGWNRLWSEPDYLPRREIHEYGEGKSAEMIAAIIQRSLN